MLNVTSKSENETFLKLHEFVSLPKLESSRNVTLKVISNHIKASTEQYNCKLFFCLDGTCNSNGQIIQLNGLRFSVDDQV